MLDNGSASFVISSKMLECFELKSPRAACTFHRVLYKQILLHLAHLKCRFLTGKVPSDVDIQLQAEGFDPAVFVARLRERE